MEKLTCADARQIDLVDFLASLGHQSQKVSNQDYWYLSPLREEKTPSFKVNRQLNVWYDHATGKGGNLIDFGIIYFKCGVSDLLQRLAKDQTNLPFSFHPPIPAPTAGEKKNATESKIVVLEALPFRSPGLVEYLQKRHIPVEIAGRFCKEVDFLLYGKKHTAIGFQNNSGGYELRSESFKGSSSPKDITFIDNRTEQIAVFEGFFNFLSFQTINRNQQAPLTNCLVLNSLAFLEKSRPLMEKYEQIHLLLDRDNAGINQTKQALKWDNKYIDRSDFYRPYKDLNDWLTHQKPRQKEAQRIGRKL